MKRFILLLILLAIEVVSAGLDIEIQTSSIDVFVNNTFEINFTTTCSEEICNDFIAIQNYKFNITDYYHPNGSLEQDCFGETCLYMENHGPVYNSSGKSNWGAGECSNVSGWAGSDMTELAKSLAYIPGMKNILGVPLCLETNNGDLWDIVFSEWSSSGSNEFGYNRSIKIETFLSNGFYLEQGKIKKNIELYENQSKIIRFPIVASEVGEFEVIFSSEYEVFVLNINVKEKPTETEEDNKEDSSKKSSYSNINSEKILYDSYNEMLDKKTEVIHDSDIKEIKVNFNKKEIPIFHWEFPIILSIILIFLFLILIIKKK